MADIFDVVADGTRRELLSRLLELANDPASAHGEISVGRLVTELGISQPTVSKHLKTLREHGLVQVREEGQHRYYRLDSAPLVELESWVAPFVGAAYDAVEGEEGSAVYAAWAGSEVGGRLGRVAAETAHSARSALEGVQDRIEVVGDVVTERLPKWAKRG